MKLSNSFPGSGTPMFTRRRRVSVNGEIVVHGINIMPMHSVDDDVDTRHADMSQGPSVVMTVSAVIDVVMNVK